jgi:hypothetical protein
MANKKKLQRIAGLYSGSSEKMPFYLGGRGENLVTPLIIPAGARFVVFPVANRQSDRAPDYTLYIEESEAVNATPGEDFMDEPAPARSKRRTFDDGSDDNDLRDPFAE